MHSAAVDIDKSDIDCHTEFTERIDNNMVLFDYLMVSV